MTIGRILGNDKDMGSGFALATLNSGSTRIVLTANHVVRGREASSLQFVTRTGQKIPVDRVERDDDLEVAVLHLGKDVVNGLAVALAVRGAAWQVETQPLGNDPKLTGTITEVHRSFKRGLGRSVMYVVQLQVDQNLGEYKGYSGSPVALQSPTGGVIGVLIEQLPSRLFAPSGQPNPATNVLYAIPIHDVLTRFSLTKLAVPVNDGRRRFLITVGTGAFAMVVVGAVMEFIRKTVLELVSVSTVSEWSLSGESFNDLEYSPDNMYLAAARGDNTAQIISISTGIPLVTYRRHTKFVNSISWAKDGERVVTGSSDGTAQVWRAHDGTWLLTYKGHNDVVTCAAWSPDGITIASGSYDKTVQIWKPISDATPVTFRGHTTMVSWVAWSPDSKQLASSDKNGNVLIWNASSGIQIGAPYKGHHEMVYIVRWSPDGTKIASAGLDAQLRIWDARTHKDITICQKGTNIIYDLSWSPDNTHLISGSEDKTFHIWKVGIPYPLATYQDTSAVHCTVYSRDGNQIATGNQGNDTIGNLRIWKANWFV